MNDVQILTVAIAIAFPVSALLLSNSRVSDAKETLRAELKAMKAGLDVEFTKINNKLDHLLEIVGRHEERLGK